MKKALCAIIIAVCVMASSPAFAVNYYVKNGGNNASDGLTDATAWETVAGVRTKTGTLVSGDWVLFKRGGTWDEELSVSEAGLNFGAYGTDTTPPIFTNVAGPYSGEVLAANQTHYGLWFKNWPVYVWSKDGTKFQYCIFSDLPSGQTGNISTGDAATTVTVQNCLFTSSKGYACVYGSANHIVQNNIFFGNALTYAPIYAAGGESSYSNNLFGGGDYTPNATGKAPECKAGGTGVCTDDGSNQKLTDTTAPNPKFTSHRYTARPKVVFSISNDIAFAVCVMTSLQAYGVKGTYNPYAGFVGAGSVYPNAASAGMCVGGPYDLTDAQDLIDSGDLTYACRGGYNNPMTAAIAASAAVISSTNGGDLALTVDGVAKTLTLTSSGNPENNVALDWNADATMYDADIDAAISGKGWSMVNTYNFRLSSLKDTACAAFPCTVPYDDQTGANRWFYDESIAATASIEAFLSRNIVETWNWPGQNGATNTDFVSYLYTTSGLSGAAEVDSAPTANGTYLDSYNIYTMRKVGLYVGAGYLLGAGTDSAIKAGARSIWAWGAQTGGVIYLLNENGGAGSSLSQMQTFVTEMNALGVEWVYPSELITALVASHTTADGLTYTKTYAHGDYRLQRGSTAINAGANVSLTTDILGNPIKGLPDIGPYEYQSSSGGGSLLMW